MKKQLTHVPRTVAVTTALQLRSGRGVISGFCFTLLPFTFCPVLLVLFME